MSLRAEIFEQPAVIERLLRDQQRTVTRIAAEIRARDIQYVVLAARGTSKHAGLYASFVWGASSGLPFVVASPSMFTVYRQPPRLRNALVVGISQSGQSPDVVEVVSEGSAQGCLTLAVTNTPDSPLAHAADLVLHIQAGPERAVAATKTYTTQLTALAMLAAALRDEPALWEQFVRLPEWVEQMLQLDDDVALVAERYRFMHKCVVLGRGYNYATALEWALKLKELTYVYADPYSTADFQHGPIAMVDAGFPVLAVAPDGTVFDAMRPVLDTIRHDLDADLLVLSDRDDALDLAQSAVRLPTDVPEWLSPIVAVLPAQLFAYHLASVKRLDTEQPRNIQKVTETF